MNAVNSAPTDKLFRLVFALIMGFLMVGIVTFVTTASNFGFGNNFLQNWGKTYLIGYLAAVPAIYLLAPIARQISARILN
ncbi:DUF2798 domain-containing protein [Limnobacter parvus]|uniref:DUF2798 domain-containing protein n=1 Tax=Limnobacter parvus TaxID=2939690 RepID=UPI00353004AB